MIQIHLAQILGAKKWSQAELARCTGIRPSTINEMYHEIIPRLTVDHLNKICEALGCTAADLIEYIPDPTPSTGPYLILEEHGRRKKRPE